MSKGKIKDNKYLKYSGLAFELFAFLGILIFIGKQIDAYFQFDKNYSTAGLLFVGLVAYLYKIVRDTSKNET